MKTYTFFFSLLLIISCSEDKKLSKELASEKIIVISDTTYNATGAYFSINSANSIILNWSEEIDTSKTNILKFKIYNTKSNNFGKTITVNPSKGMQAHSESMAKIARNAKGVLYAVFRFHEPTPKNKHSGSIFYTTSIDDGQTWSEKRKLVNDENSQSQAFFDIALLPDGELGLSWLDNRKLDKDKDGSSLFFAKSKGDLGFFDEKPIAGSTCQCCRTEIFVEPNSTINVAFRNIAEGSIRDMYRTTSIDNGEIFSTPVPMGKDNWKIDGCPHTGPSIAYNSKDLAVIWFTGANSGIGIFFKKLSDEITFYENKILISSTGMHPQMIGLENDNYYIVYDEIYKVDNNNFSQIILHTLMPDGAKLTRKLSKPNSMNDHPVITKINNNQLLIAWVNKVNGKSKINYLKIDAEK